MSLRRLALPCSPDLGYVLVPAKIVYYAVPKVACTSLKWQMAELQGEDRGQFDGILSLEAVPDLAIHDRASWRRTPTIHEVDGSALGDWAAGEDWFRFAVVRDPVARTWSGWQSKILSRDPRYLVDYPELMDFPTPETIDDVLGLFADFVALLADPTQRIGRDYHFQAQTAVIPTPGDGIAGPRIFTTAQIPELQLELARHVKASGRELPPLRRSNEALFDVPTSALPRETVTRLVTLFAADYDAFPLLRRPQVDGTAERSSVPPEAIALLPHIWERNQRVRDIALTAFRRLQEPIR